MVERFSQVIDVVGGRRKGGGWREGVIEGTSRGGENGAKGSPVGSVEIEGGVRRGKGWRGFVR